MRGKAVTRIPFGEQSPDERHTREFLESRRLYNRLYMRAWRTDPRHRADELRHRQRWEYERKLRSVQRERRPFTDDSGEPVCGFCRKDRPIRVVARLRISEDADARFVPVQVPYCGHC
jgi:hypothetical protein